MKKTIAGTKKVGTAVSKKEEEAAATLAAQEREKELAASVQQEATAAAALAALEAEKLKENETKRVVDRSFLEAPLDHSRLKRSDRILKHTLSMHGLESLECSPSPETKRKMELRRRRHSHSGNIFTVSTDPFQIKKLNKCAETGNENIPMPYELKQALALRDRRLVRRKNRKIGIPPDPNDSDDSLLAELNEITDDKLFPGLDWNHGAKKVAESINPVRPNMLKKKLKSIAREEEECSAAIHSKPLGSSILEPFSPDSRKAFESLVLQKYYKNGLLLSDFKDKGGIKKLKPKNKVKKQIREIKQETDLTNESNVADGLEKTVLVKCRTTEESQHEKVNGAEFLEPRNFNNNDNNRNVTVVSPVSLLPRLGGDTDARKESMLKFSNSLESQQRQEFVCAKNLEILKTRVAKIRKTIAESKHKTKKHFTLANDNVEAFSVEGNDNGADTSSFSESPAVRESRRKIIKHKMEMKAAYASMLERQERNRMHILKKIIDLDDLERYGEKKLESALINLVGLPSLLVPQVKCKSILIIPPVLNNGDDGTSIDVLRKNPPRPLPAPKHTLTSSPQQHHQYQQKSDTIIASPFMPNPSTVIFKDYEPQQVYKKTVRVTNTSYRVNTFKLLPISVELATFFQVLAPTPGRMSAGMVCPVEFFFKPPAGYNRDIIDGVVEFEAEFGGKFCIRLGCAAKKCLPRIVGVSGPGIIRQIISPHPTATAVNTSGDAIYTAISKEELSVNFGPCVQGGTVVRNIRIYNDGAVKTEIEITNLDPGPFILSDKYLHSVSIEGYSFVSIGIVFQPERLDTVNIVASKKENRQEHAKYLIKFSAPDVSPIIFSCTGSILSSPLNIDKLFLDFGVGVVGSTYLEQIYVKNYSNVAFRFWIEVEGMNNKSLNFNYSQPKIRSATSTEINDFGSNVCTDGIDSDLFDEDFAQTNINFFSDEFLEEDDHVANIAATQSSRNLAITSDLQPNQKTLSTGLLGLTPKSLALSRSPSVNIGASETPQFVIRPLKRTGRNSATISKRADNLELEVQNMGELEISPKLGIVQPFQSAPIFFKVKPTRSGHIILKNGENPYFVKFQIKYMYQGVETPLPLSVTGRVTTSDIDFSIPGKPGTQIFFNECTLAEVKEIPIKVSNNSRIPQKVRITSSDASIWVVFKPHEDIDGFLSIEPLSHQIRMVRFEPEDVGLIRSRLSCHSIWNRNFELKCSGFGVQPMLRLNASEVRFAALGLGSQKSTKLKIMCLGSKTTSFGSSVNLSKISSVVKQTWKLAPNSTGKKNIANENENVNGGRAQHIIHKSDETISFEFGNPKIIGVYQRNQLAQIAKGALENAKKAEDHVKKIGDAAREAVERTDPSLMKQFFPTTVKSAIIPEFNPKAHDPFFSSHEPIHSNPRILVPAETETILDSSGEKFVPFCPEDMAPVGIFPRTGMLGPGDTMDITLKLCPPPIESLAVIKMINEKMMQMAQPAQIEMSMGEPETQLAPAEKKEDNSKAGKESKETKLAVAVNANTSELELNLRPEPVIYPEFDSNVNLGSSNILAAKKPMLAQKLDLISDVCLVILVPCKISCTEFSLMQIQKPATESKKDRKIRKSSDIIYLRIIAPIVAPEILLLDPEHGVIDFGTVPLNQQVVREFKIFNNSENIAQLGNFSHMNTNEPYKLMTELSRKFLRPFEEFSVKISFKPTQQLSFSCKFEIYSKTSQVAVKLVGNGVAPSIQIEPNEKSLFLGDIAIGDIKFAPDHESDLYFETILVDVWGASKPTEFQIHGRCWDVSSTLQGYERPPVTLCEYFPFPELDQEYAQKLFNGEFSRPVLLNEITVEHESVSKSSVQFVSNAKPAADAKKKQTAPTSKEKDTQAKPDNEDSVIGEILRQTDRVNTRFALVTCTWKKHDSGKWFVEQGEIRISSLKPANFTKQETKQSPHTEFFIESWNGSFEYSEQYRNYRINSGCPQTADEPMVKFCVDVKKGTVEYGTSKSLQIKLLNETHRFWGSIAILKKTSLDSKFSESDQQQSEDLQLFDVPFAVDTYLKITLKGGIRYVDPKGLVSMSESRVWILKITAKKQE
ncbi:hypothetical protein HK100_006076 [Physocladia obscura]|uniref:CFAP74 fourth Ig-like domain-containing protein n=1 Tax=Physocladia obscura TaxID=109957 RepID=A0AAD5T5E1_9FUNG|nr:hypothetical protein HK100_006076 [Physocladia obscura]